MIFFVVISSRSPVSITTNNLRFHCAVPDIDWPDLKMLESIVSVLPSDFHCLGAGFRNVL